MDYSRGSKNPHVRTSEKRPCSKCGELAKHYSDGTIEQHKEYLYRKIRGVFHKTSKWSYCSNKMWQR